MDPADPREDAVTGPTVRVLDLFAGAGGLSEAFRTASPRFTTARAVELDTAAAATYAANHGDVVHAGGIHDWLSREEIPEVDVVIGGPPCQGFSALGLQQIHDERNTLWREYAETVRRSRPRFFVLENVGPFEKSEQYAGLRAATSRRGSLREYAVSSRILNAADYGAPQARKRCIVIGRHRDLPDPGWPEPTHARFPEADLAPWRSVRQALRGVPRRVERVDLPDRVVRAFGATLPGPFTSRELHVIRYYTPTSRLRFAMIRPGGNRHDLPDDLKAPCWVKHTTGSADVMGRLRWDEPSVTIRTEFFKPEKGRYLHPEQNRTITHYEAALLQGFPRDYRWVGTKSAIARQIGNAVPIPLGAALGTLLLQALDAADGAAHLAHRSA